MNTRRGYDFRNRPDGDVREQSASATRSREASGVGTPRAAGAAPAPSDSSPRTMPPHGGWCNVHGGFTGVRCGGRQYDARKCGPADWSNHANVAAGGEFVTPGKSPLTTLLGRLCG